MTNLTKADMRLTLEPQAPAHRVGLKSGKTNGGVDLLPEDLVGVIGGHLLDVHAAFGRGHDDVAGHGPVEQDRQVELTSDVDPLLDVEAVHFFASFAGLDRDQGGAQHLLGECTHFGHCCLRASLPSGEDHVHALEIWVLGEGSLAPAAGVNLRLDHHHRIARFLDQGAGGGLRLDLVVATIPRGVGMPRAANSCLAWYS